MASLATHPLGDETAERWIAAMTIGDQTTQVPCIKCGLFDLRANLVPLGFWLEEGAPLPRVAGYKCAWVHLVCWQGYSELTFELEAMDVAAEMAVELRDWSRAP